MTDEPVPRDGDAAGQLTLAGEAAETGAGFERERPRTLLYCGECSDWVLRSRRRAHPHDLAGPGDFDTDDDADADGDGDDDDDGDDPDEVVGHWYDITLSYTVNYRFRVPAWSRHRAEDLAKEWRLDADPADMEHVHTRRERRADITLGEVRKRDPEWDPYGRTELWEVLLGDE